MKTKSKPSGEVNDSSYIRKTFTAFIIAISFLISFSESKADPEDDLLICISNCWANLVYYGQLFEIFQCLDDCMTAYNSSQSGWIPGPTGGGPDLANSGQSMSLDYARRDNSGNVLTGRGNVLSATFHAIRIDSLLSASNIDSVQFHSIGSGNFNSQTSSWILNWTPPYYYSSDNLFKGYAVRVDFNDSLIGVVSGLGFVVIKPIVLDIKIIPEGFLYAASINTTRSNIKDKSTVSLRSANSPYQVIDTTTVVIDSLTLSGSCFFNNVVPGNYYISVKHRNSVETWSANPVTFTADSTSYDFTSSQSKAYGNNLVLKLGKWCTYSGDVSQDGYVDASDVAVIDNAAYNFSTGYIASDLTGDGFVDASDLSIVDNNVFNYVAKIIPAPGPVTHYIGESFGGGIVFYVDSTAQHGLIAAPTNQSTGSVWWNGSNIFITTGNPIGTGQSNTNSIVNLQGTGNYAASICKNLTLNGYSDWFLPSIGELNALYNQRAIVGGFTNDIYWSSSQNTLEFTWSLNFSSGNISGISYKSTANYVRAIRAF